jgi:hypothetical protein
MALSHYIRRAQVGLGLLASITLAAGFTNAASADHPCEQTWQTFASGGQIGVNTGSVLATTVWNGDLIAGGEFTTAGGQTVNRIARWDGSEWHPFTSDGQIGVDNKVHALTVWNGDLIVGGLFTTAGGQTVNRIARWDGEAWHSFTSGGEIGVDGFGVLALTEWNGNLIAGGFFTTAGGQTVNHIARWDGSAWRASIAGGEIGVNNIVNALTVWNGFPVAAGQFTTAGGQTVNRIATWQACPNRGACCVNGVVIEVFADECAAIGGVFFGKDVAPEDVQCDPKTPPCVGDLNFDGVVDVSDLLQLLSNWGVCPSN